jgi:hypothetical protein
VSALQTAAPSAREDLEFLLESTRVAAPLERALALFHQGGEAGLKEALALCEEAEARAKALFPDVVDPIGAEGGSLRRYLALLRERLRP